jgi:hypothetical protein
MLAIIPRPAPERTPPPDIGPLACVLANSDPYLWAEQLPGETPEQTAARQDAAAHILDDLLAELIDDLELEIAA